MRCSKNTTRTLAFTLYSRNVVRFYAWIGIEIEAIETVCISTCTLARLKGQRSPFSTYVKETSDGPTPRGYLISIARNQEPCLDSPSIQSFLATTVLVSPFDSSIHELGAYAFIDTTTSME
eukprot:scaffold932_cov328-Pavlova_lutheri.AAC.46